MNKTLIIPFSIAALVGIITIVIFLIKVPKGLGCDEIPALFEGKDISVDLIDNYMMASGIYESIVNEPNDDIRIYVDKSSGINEAFSSSLGGRASKDLLGEIMNNYRGAKFYSVLNNIAPFDLNGADPSNYFVNPNNYEKVNGQSADLLSALNQISEYNGLSFLITDAEQFDATKNEITTGAWAIEPLKKWINQGNSIHFWITDFQVINKDNKIIKKHLFFMAFVPAKVAIEKPFTDLVKSLNNINPIHLELTNNSWKILKPEWSEQSTGIDERLMAGDFDKDAYMRRFDNPSGSYEFISVGLPIKSDYLSYEKGALSKPQFYRDLYIDLSNNKFFDISNLDIEVYEVTQDLVNFARFEEVDSDKPDTTKDPNNHETIINPDHRFSCYYELKGDKIKLKDSLRYRKNYDVFLLKEFFEFDKEIFMNSIKNNISKVELGLRFHKNFNDSDSKLVNNYPFNILRVDFKIDDFKDKTVSELDYFTWSSMWKPNEKNSGFGKSVEQVIKSTQPKGKVIHTLFIKFIKE